MENYKCKSVGIIGSGIQGVCTGLQLIKKGIPVTIFDRQDPLSLEFKPASYGNAGHFSPYAVLQLNRPDILFDVPKMLFSSYGPLALKWNYVPKMLNWFFYYLKNCNKKSMMHTAKNMHQILSLSNDAYEEIFQEIDTNGLVEAQRIVAKRSAALLAESIFPIRVVDIFNDEIYLNYGDSILSVGDRLKVIQEGREIIDQATGLSLGSRQKVLGEIEIVSADSNLSIAKIIKNDAEFTVGAVAKIILETLGSKNKEQRERKGKKI